MNRYQPTPAELARPVKVTWTDNNGQQQQTTLPRGSAPALVEWLLSNGVEYRSIKNA